MFVNSINSLNTTTANNYSKKKATQHSMSSQLSNSLQKDEVSFSGKDGRSLVKSLKKIARKGGDDEEVDAEQAYKEMIDFLVRLS